MLRKTDYRFTPVGTGVLRKTDFRFTPVGTGCSQRERLQVYTNGDRLCIETDYGFTQVGTRSERNGLQVYTSGDRCAERNGLQFTPRGGGCVEEKQISGLHLWEQVVQIKPDCRSTPVGPMHSVSINSLTRCKR